MNTTIRTSVINQIGHIELNRPQALNSLSLEMIRTLTATLTNWKSETEVKAVLIYSSSERAFCAGGDIRFFYEVGSKTPQGGSALLEDFFTEEYALNHLIHHYPKPYIALMNGVVMGGGMGIAQAGPQSAIRIVTEKTKMAMPEVNIGLFPDVGGGYFLSRMPGQTGRYLGLTGEIIRGEDAIETGLADIFLRTEHIPDLMQLLKTCDTNNLKNQLMQFSESLQTEVAENSFIKKNRQYIDHYFSGNSVSEIYLKLKSGEDSFAQSVTDAMSKRSPLMMCVTLEQLKRSVMMNVADCLRMERTMVRHCFERTEVIEGIRALVIDKDNQPRWQHQTVDDVSEAEVESFFVAVWPDITHPLRMLTDSASA
ncbi:enoyl-CoA hydratase/isomerase family protein [Undibacterium luofuense]|mgnify:CR=1 FL=1|uniref:enoyl-CoA hydratase/isomerase family protein n=1 Tax=Undibacterium luofuense TaxID=2828733 RepID=UPI0030EB5607